MKALHLSLTTPSTAADHQALEWHFMRPKGIEDLATFSFRAVKRAAAEEGDEYCSTEEQWESKQETKSSQLAF